MVHSRIDAGRHVVDSCSDIIGKQDARKNGILLLLLADERIPKLQVLVDKWKYCNESRHV
jgi:hypothetical protein